MAPANASFDQIVATTLKNYRNVLADNITNHEVLWFELKRRGFVREEDGGETIVEQLLHTENNTVRSFDGYDLLDTTPQEGISAAEYAWKQIAGTVSISGRQEFQNSGSKVKLLGLLQAKIQQLETSMRLQINEQLFGDGTGNNNKDLTGLNLAIENGAAFSVYGGIDSNVFTFWRNTFVGTVGSFAANGVDTMRTVVNSASRGKDKIGLIVTTQDIFEAYEKTLQPLERFEDKTLGDAGFMNLMYKKIPMVFDEDCPSGTMFFLNPSYMRFVIGRGKNFANTPFVKPDNQEAKLSQVIFYGNLTSNARKRNGRADGITTP